MDDNKFLPKLSKNLLELLDNDDEYHDIIIEVGNDPYVKIFRAHIVILNYRSPYLRRILSTNEKNNDGTLTHIKLPNILPEPFQIILRYIYGGKISLEEHDTLDIIKILVAANELRFDELITHLQSFLITNRTDWMEQNFNFTYKTSFESDSFLELQNYCTDLMSREPNKIFESIDFSTIPKKLLLSLIQDDNLQMNEIEVWDYVLKWGLAQNPELSSDPSNYSDDDFNILKNTLQPCIPFIRFHNLTSKEFLKIKPYKKILPEEFLTDLLTTFMDSDSKPKSRKAKKNNDQNINQEEDSLKSLSNDKNTNQEIPWRRSSRRSNDGDTDREIPWNRRSNDGNTNQEIPWRRTRSDWNTDHWRSTHNNRNTETFWRSTRDDERIETPWRSVRDNKNANQEKDPWRNFRNNK